MKTKTKNLILLFLVVIIASLIPALVFGKWIEAVIFILCHTLIRPQFRKQYHHVIPAICREISGVVAFFGISFVLPLGWSLFSAVPINYFIGWIGCIKRDRDDLEVKCMWLRDKMQQPETQLILKCRMAGLSERDTKIAKMYYIDRKRPKDIWYWICEHKEYDSIEWDSVHQLLWRIGKKINKISL
jgi:hypothetical protein